MAGRSKEHANRTGCTSRGSHAFFMPVPVYPQKKNTCPAEKYLRCRKKVY